VEQDKMLSTAVRHLGVRVKFVVCQPPECAQQLFVPATNDSGIHGNTNLYYSQFNNMAY